MLLSLVYDIPLLLLFLLFSPSSTSIPSPQDHNHPQTTTATTPQCSSTKWDPGKSGICSTHSNHHPHVWHKFEKLVHAKKGSQLEGIVELKKYFHHFGYYHHIPINYTNNFTNVFDAHLERAVTRYQKSYNLPISGTLNPMTLSLIMSPRCGLPDHYHVTSKLLPRHYQYFLGQPRWARQIPMTLTYAFSLENMIQYLSLHDIRAAFERAFSKWASVIPVKFVIVDDYSFADIRIGFYGGEHGDGEPFDGVLGVLAHAFSPESGRFHLDAAETWAVDFKKEKSKMAVDLESVALHEIGHVLGLSHSNVKESVMFPSLKPRDKKLDLKFDDIKGVQNLYGSNPNFTIGSLLESETSSNSPNDLRMRPTRLVLLLLLVLSSFFVV